MVSISKPNRGSTSCDYRAYLWVRGFYKMPGFCLGPGGPARFVILTKADHKWRGTSVKAAIGDYRTLQKLRDYVLWPEIGP